MKTYCDETIIHGIAYNGGLFTVPGWKYPIVIDLWGLSLPLRVPIHLFAGEYSYLLGRATPQVKDNKLYLVGSLDTSKRQLDKVKAIITSLGAQAQAESSLAVDVLDCTLRNSPDSINNHNTGIGHYYHVTKAVLTAINVVYKDNKTRKG